MTFQTLLVRLRTLLREKVKNGELTERGMARLTETSQPHLHNILKGIRTLPPELADRLLVLAGVTLPDLMAIGPQEADVPAAPTSGSFDGDAPNADPGHLPATYLPDDPEMEPEFRAGDLVYYDVSTKARTELDTKAAYLVSNRDRTAARYLRLGGKRLYLASANTLNDPLKWDYVSLADRHILEIVRGRIVWIWRKVEALEAEPPEEAGGSHRRIG